MKYYKYAVFVVGIIVTIYFLTLDNCKKLRETVFQMQFSGAVEKKFRDYDHRGVTTITVNGDNFVIYNQDAFDGLSIGDTVIKFEHQYRYVVLKGRDSVPFYAICEGKYLQ